MLPVTPAGRVVTREYGIAVSNRPTIRLMDSHLSSASIGTGDDKKKGTEIDLTEQQNEFIMNILTTGYLSELERCFTAGDISDYPLFPGSRLKNGVSRARQTEDSLPGNRRVVAPQPVSEDGLRGWFQAFEKAIGIRHVGFRGWYRVRRATADMAEDAVSDARPLNFITGHADTKTRRGYRAIV